MWNSKEMYHIFCIRSYVEGHLGTFQHLAIINEAAMTIVRHVSLCMLKHLLGIGLGVILLDRSSCLCSSRAGISYVKCLPGSQLPFWCQTQNDIILSVYTCFSTVDLHFISFTYSSNSLGNEIRTSFYYVQIQLVSPAPVVTLFI